MAYRSRMATDTGWTAERVYALPDDGQRYEVLDGELAATPAPGQDHQDVAGALYVRLRQYVRRHDVGYAYLSPADIEFSPTRLVQPDLFVAPKVEGRKPAGWKEMTHLRLAVEILSPGTARRDRGKKRLIYQSQGVEEYWIVDVDARCVQRWRPSDERPQVVHDVLDWRPDPALDPLAIDLPALFGDALG